MALTRKLQFLAQENVSITLVHTDARVMPDTVDGTALLTSMTASHHLAKTVSKDFNEKLISLFANMSQLVWCDFF